jgi:3-dehydroquinate dehydratase-1
MKFPVAHPAVVGSITTAAGLKKLGLKKLPVDAVEIRLDALRAVGIDLAKVEKALHARRHPVLLTVRIPSEGGHGPCLVAERIDLYLHLLPLVEAIDLELATVKPMRIVVREAMRQGKTVVFSAHALAHPASQEQVAKWISQYDGEPNTILKIAAHIRSWRDLQQLAALLVNHPDWPIAVMGLGPHARQSRSVLAALGSRLVYGYLDKPAAPGQPSAAQVRKLVETLTVKE